MAVSKELLQMDTHALLGTEEKATHEEVKKAYWQKTPSCIQMKIPTILKQPNSSTSFARPWQY